jgi:hypothetical protein
VPVAIVERGGALDELLLSTLGAPLRRRGTLLCVGGFGLARLDARHRVGEPGAPFLELRRRPHQFLSPGLQRLRSFLEPRHTVLTLTEVAHAVHEPRLADRDLGRARGDALLVVDDALQPLVQLPCALVQDARAFVRLRLSRRERLPGCLQAAFLRLQLFCSNLELSCACIELPQCDRLHSLLLLELHHASSELGLLLGDRRRAALLRLQGGGRSRDPIPAFLELGRERAELARLHVQLAVARPRAFDLRLRPHDVLLLVAQLFLRLREPALPLVEICLRILEQLGPRVEVGGDLREPARAGVQLGGAPGDRLVDELLPFAQRLPGVGELVLLLGHSRHDDAVLGEQFEEALTYATQVHASQRRKGGDVPYVAHLLGVTSLVLEDGGGEQEAVAALLHDAVEDQGGAERLEDIRARFGGEVAEIVAGCSDTDEVPKPAWRIRKEEYIAHLATARPEVVRVSLADKVHNARSVLFDYRLMGDELWKRFNPDADHLWYYRSLVEAFREVSRSPLVDELDRVVTELERVASL